MEPMFLTDYLSVYVSDYFPSIIKTHGSFRSFDNDIAVCGRSRCVLCILYVP